MVPKMLELKQSATSIIIPLAGRIVAIAGVFDALIHARPYKSEWPVQEAVDEIIGLSGAHVDPTVEAAFHRALISRGEW